MSEKPTPTELLQEEAAFLKEKATNLQEKIDEVIRAAAAGDAELRKNLLSDIRDLKEQEARIQAKRKEVSEAQSVRAAHKFEKFMESHQNDLLERDIAEKRAKKSPRRARDLEVKDRTSKLTVERNGLALELKKVNAALEAFPQEIMMLTDFEDKKKMSDLLRRRGEITEELQRIDTLLYNIKREA